MKKIKFLHLTVLTFILTVCFFIPIHATPNRYDDLGRLTQFFYENGDSIIYTYDAVGNITGSTFVRNDFAHTPDNSIVTFIVDGNVNICASSSPLVQSVPQGEDAIEPTISREGGWIWSDWSVPFNNVTENITVTGRLLRLGAITTGGLGHVTSEDVTYLARHIVGHAGFEIQNRRIANLLGEDRIPTLADVTMFARWLVGYDLAYLQSQLSSGAN